MEGKNLFLIDLYCLANLKLPFGYSAVIKDGCFKKSFSVVLLKGNRIKGDCTLLSRLFFFF